ncbi:MULTISPECIES: hypothetical protein [unclassified Actinomyces]|uniref:hypothetical protein n=1 Tax=unclassified Actinomyces TaxID=2609248 RepID=UPI000D590A3E|nr:MULTISPECIES: hypothetical protein [unclassified Actinomyces]RAX18869.1 hypothetical protein DRB07_15205 [Actinomyces sp. Z3]RAX19351.1 hypothetical protein DRB06_13620 [Actinomyces sp. Z5]
MPSSPTYDADDDDVRMAPNRKLEAIREVKHYAQGSRYRLDAWEPASTTDSTSQHSETFDAGLNENVWTSPVADDYRTDIDTADSGAYDAIGDIVSDLTDAENAFYDAGLDMVPEDSALARWPLT